MPELVKVMTTEDEKDEDRASSASSNRSNSDNEEMDSGAGSMSPQNSPARPGGVARSTSQVRKRVRTTSSSANQSQGTLVYHSGNRMVFTAGRPPWYDSRGQLKEAFVIGICGGSASGKTTVAKRIIEDLNVQWVSLLSMDSFYKVLSPEQHEQAMRNEYNFDHPDAFDYDLLIATLRRLKEGKHVNVPVYNFNTHGRENYTKTIYGANVVIFEGILAYVNKELLSLLDMKVFVDTDSDIRLARRLKRDIQDRGRDIEGVLKQYNTFVKPSFDHYIAPTMTHADIIVPRGGENEIAISLIVLHVHQQLNKRGHQFRSELCASTQDDDTTPETLHKLPDTFQIKGLHTFIRNKDTPRDEFIFYSNRLMRLLIEYALSMLPFKEVEVVTPQAIKYEGKRLNTQKICGVSILRAGETMEPALCEVCKDVRLGKILIQTNLDTGEPELHYCRLPKDIADSHVLLMDATVATGAAAMMAIHVLLDHDVPEQNIMLLSLIMAKPGVNAVAYAFPKVKLVTTAVDPDINEQFHILPGIGNFGDRYFGTENQFKEFHMNTTPEDEANA